MNPADIAALLYGIIALGEAAGRAIHQLKASQISDEEFERAWEAMKSRLADANALLAQARAIAESAQHDHDDDARPAT